MSQYSQEILQYSQPSGLQLFCKETPTQLFSWEYCKFFKNAYFGEHLWTAASKTDTGANLLVGKYKLSVQ